jgi:hypothetical protein
MASCSTCESSNSYLFADYQLRRVRDGIGSKPEIGFENTIGEASLKDGFSPPEKIEPPEAGSKSEAGESSTDDSQVVEKLRARDAEVRSHEAAHLAAAGAHASGGSSFTYQVGPDGKPYAIGGEVQVDVSPVANDPQATIQKMQQIRAAALSPSDPSSADRAVAARAAQIEAEARAEIAEKAAGNPAKGYFKQPDESAGTYFSAAA